MKDKPKESWIVDEPDGGPLGVLLEFQDGLQIWSGEVSRHLFEEQGEEVMASLGGDDCGTFVMISNGREATDIVCRAASVDHGIAIAKALASAMRNQST